MPHLMPEQSRFAERRVSPLELELDPYNPRLALKEEGSSPESLLEIMDQRFKIDEIAESIIAGGYRTFDPLVGWAHDGTVIVLEGNRRVAAAKLLLKPDLSSPRTRAKWNSLASRLSDAARKSLDTLPIRVYRDRYDPEVLAYIGFRHVTGVLTWPSLEKAEYIARLIERQGWNYTHVAEHLGSYPRHVERYYVAHQLVKQVRDNEIPGYEQIPSAFGVLLRALQASGIPEFLGVEYPNDAQLSKLPVSAERLGNLKDFVLWTFGTDETRRLLPDSRRLTDWARILQSPDAVSYLRRTKNPTFERAFFKSGGQVESVANSLFDAADRLEESVPLVPDFKEDSDVKEAVGQVARFFVQVVKSFPEIAIRYGIGKPSGG